jgi:hypothetical protein
MNVETWTGAAQFPEKEDVNGIFVAVQRNSDTFREYFPWHLG